MSNNNKIFLVVSTLIFIGGLTYYLVQKNKVKKEEENGDKK
jgi:hypothetical protein